ncbi:hypothetical protein MCOR27_005214 [Pyricularia oryzae]|uniref:Histidinol-phosphatase n=5 Tax=Pyricularia TaxID=48558 RepID=A0ABQ8NWH2_PYRGI|nr:histidinol-phosphatase [Pyricularia oryzae 70-15]KAH8847331.1 hypothetical protein MCOR01_000770 [Pyricularia oryzae]KAI6303014.1 hypothetical protein MCOR33_001790 [Pyricularia grisea]EHA52082.1 histidinol-phosphatase [Pyricularia oryzae 70-15]KAH9428469.1 hypothetical protein MCOR02_011019 [Pyricularia oryzae]KAI6259945.1 hypothetical protein MCOR19_003769 [Pyricularia oryzae]
MAFTMHSHSGQFCPGHAKDQLEDVILHAISIGYKTMGLSEHMPRTQLCDLYPEELVPDPHASLAELMPRHAAYMTEARRLQKKYADRITLLIGFEGEFIRSEYGTLVRSLADGNGDPSYFQNGDSKLVTDAGKVDYFIGSLHHGAGGIPIDFDRATYLRSVEAAGPNGEEDLFVHYYDQQFEMLQALRPPIVGHFDLIRLMSEEPGRNPSAWSPNRVWPLIKRNLAFVASYGGWLECNSSALRKGLAEPYPCRPIAEEWVRLGGKFTMSDDSHGIAQVATNYVRALDYLESLGVNEVWTYDRAKEGSELVEKGVSFTEFRGSLRLPTTASKTS